jgi:polyisoprenoid-binding protein YceI
MIRLVMIALLGLTLAGRSPAWAAVKPTSTDPADAPAGTYVLDKTHASLAAQVSHMGLSLYTMRFGGIDASYDYDPAKPLASQVKVTVDANSLDVGDPKTSQQFAKEFLGADRYPQITFVSSGMEQTMGDHGVVTGELTLNGVTRPIILNVIFNGCGPGLMGFGGYRMGFSATADIKRSDFGLKAWESLVGDDVHLPIEVEFSRK